MFNDKMTIKGQVTAIVRGPDGLIKNAPKSQAWEHFQFAHPVRLSGRDREIKGAWTS